MDITNVCISHHCQLNNMVEDVRDVQYHYFKTSYFISKSKFVRTLLPGQVDAEHWALCIHTVRTLSPGWVDSEHWALCIHTFVRTLLPSRGDNKCWALCIQTVRLLSPGQVDSQLGL